MSWLSHNIKKLTIRKVVSAAASVGVPGAQTVANAIGANKPGAAPQPPQQATTPPPPGPASGASWGIAGALAVGLLILFLVK